MRMLKVSVYIKYDVFINLAQGPLTAIIACIWVCKNKRAEFGFVKIIRGYSNKNIGTGLNWKKIDLGINHGGLNESFIVCFGDCNLWVALATEDSCSWKWLRFSVQGVRGALSENVGDRSEVLIIE